MISFLHCADLHLGMRLTRFEPQTAGKLREARFDALEKVLDTVKERQVAFVIIAGDLFDELTVDLLTARRAFEMLAEGSPVPVYVLPGNHDPLMAGGVWDRAPWNQPAKQIRLLHEAKVVEVAPGVVLLPCPVLRKTSLNDPTAWMVEHRRDGSVIRIGVAHGSLKVRDDLPPDDHLMPRHAVVERQLDYLALGHWHSPQVFADPDGVPRTAYPGVHEPMRFQNSDVQTGWVPHSGAGRSEFLDAGRGEVLHVAIPGPGEAPELTPVEVGRHIWKEEQRELTSDEDLVRLIQDVANRERRELLLLRLRLTGYLDASTMLRIQELREILVNRYFFGELDDTGLHIRPTEAEMRSLAGQGILGRLLERLQAEQTAGAPVTQRVAERAILLLHQIAREANA